MSVYIWTYSILFNSLALQNHSYGTTPLLINNGSVYAPTLTFISNLFPGLELLVECISALLFILLLKNSWMPLLSSLHLKGKAVMVCHYNYAS